MKRTYLTQDKNSGISGKRKIESRDEVGKKRFGGGGI